MTRKLKKIARLENYEPFVPKIFKYVERKLAEGELEYIRDNYEVIDLLSDARKRLYQGADAIIKDPTCKYNFSGFYSAFFHKENL